MLHQFSIPFKTFTFVCNSCNSNKIHRLPFSKNTLHSTSPLQVIYSDLWGPSPVLSIDNKRYYVLFVDQFSKYMWLFTLHNKSDVFQTFQQLHPMLERRFETKLISLYTDGGGEFQGLDHYLKSTGIEHLVSPPYTPQRVATVERRHRHILETAKTLLHQASMPTPFWSFACTHTAYLINRMPSTNLDNKSPYDILFQTKPNIETIKTFGCLCYPWLKPYSANKLQPKSTPCVYLGFSTKHHAHQCYDPITSKIFVSRDVVFHEEEFPFNTIFSNLKTYSSTLAWEILQDTSHDDLTQATTPCFDLPSPLHSLPTPAPPLSSAPSVSGTSQSHLSALPCNPTDSTLDHQIPNPTVLDQPRVYHRRSRSTSSLPRIIQPPGPAPIESPTDPNPVPQPNGSCSPPDHPSVISTHPMLTRSKTNSLKPRQFAASVTLSPTYIPRTPKQAQTLDHWRLAMQAEYDALDRNNTWTLVPFDSSKNIVGCKWLFRIKYRPDGSIDRYKARMVAKGYTQRPGIDYHATFSPVVKPVTVRLVLTIATQNSWPIHQLDVNNAFLQGHLDEEVYMQQPPGFENADFPNHVCRLNKAIYGLKQAPRAWYNELKSYLLQLGFAAAKSDSSLFIIHRHDVTIYVLVYVDDIIITGSSLNGVRAVIDALSNRFSLKDLGNLHYFLGVEVTSSANGLFLSQSRYILDTLDELNMAACKGAPTPMTSTIDLTSSPTDSLVDATLYRRVIGKLHYLAFTRPDIAYTVNKLSQFMHTPSEVHWRAAKRVLRYLKQTVDLGLVIDPKPDRTLRVYSDSDWAGDPVDRTSTTGFIVYLGQTPISWSSKKQRSVSRSSTEAEYRAVAAAVSETNWIQHLLSELRISLPRAPTVYCDNVSTTYICANPVLHSRMKHVAIDFHFVREQVQRATINVEHLNALDQVADILTKPLPRAAFDRNLLKLGLGEHTLNLRGRNSTLTST